MNAIYLRSSVRQYTDEPVDIRDIEKLMRAAMAAPSAVNQQPWEFYIARDETTRLALAASSPYGTPAKLAPCVIVACQRTEGLRAPKDASYDMSASVENILIEAANLGLGAVWLGIAPEKDRMAAVDVALGSPGEMCIRDRSLLDAQLLDGVLQHGAGPSRKRSHRFTVAVRRRGHKQRCLTKGH